MFFFRDTDSAVVRRTLAGHPEAFEVLVFRYQKKAHALARSTGLRQPETDDAVQEAFLQAFRDLPSLREPASFGSWFLNIVRHVALKLLKKAAQRANQPAASPPPAATTQAGGSSESLEHREFSEYLWGKVAELPEGVRETVFLYYYEGGSIREVARALGVSGAAVKKRLKGGRDQLREKLWRELEECLRDMLPSTRQWQRRARRLSFLILGSIPASWAAKAGAFAQLPDAGPLGSGPRSAQGNGDVLCLLAARTRALVRSAERGGLFAGKQKLAAWMGLGILLIILAAGVSLAPRFMEGGNEGPKSALRSSNPAIATSAGKSNVKASDVQETAKAPVKAEVEQKPESEEPAPEPAPPEEKYGSVLVRVVWGDDRTPASGVRGMVIPWGSPHLYIDERTFITGPDGTVQVDRVFMGGATVYLDRGGTASLRIDPSEVGEAVVEIPPGFNVEGVVVDRQGFPVGGARVWISQTGHTNWGYEVAETLADGSYSIRSIKDSLHIAARAAGHAPSDLRSLKGEAGSTLQMRIRLNGPAGAVAGMVIDGRGSPVTHAKVMVGAEYSHYTLLEDGTTGLSGPPYVGFTGDDGGFRAESVPPGKTRLAVRAPGFVPLEEWVEVQIGSTSEVELVLAEGAMLTGRVTGSEGQPATGVMVTTGDARDFLSIKVFSSGDGSYRLAGLPPGEVEVHAARPGWGRAATKLLVKGGEALRWDAVLTQDREIAGRVLDENGSPLAGYRVLAEEMVGQGARRATQKKLQTDEEGRFRIPELSDLTYRILVFEPESSFPCLFADGVRPGSEDVVVEVERESLSSAFLMGKILDPAGNPAAEAKVICFSAVAGYRTSFADKKSGEFQFGPIPPGGYRIEVQAQGHPPLEAEVELLSSRERRDLGILYLKERER